MKNEFLKLKIDKCITNSLSFVWLGVEKLRDIKYLVFVHVCLVGRMDNFFFFI